MKFRTFSILFISLVSIRVCPQDVIVKTAFDTSKITIGDQIHFTVTVDHPTGMKLDIPHLKDTLTGHIEIISGPVTDSLILQDKRMRIIEKYLVTSFDSGFYQVPPVFAEMREGNMIKRFFSDYAPLEVARIKISPPDTTAKIFDIIRPYRAPITAGDILPWLILSVVTSVAIWRLLKFLKNRKPSRHEPEVVINPDPAHVIAFRELEKLKDEKLWQRGEIKLYYTRLTEILRQYLENRFRVFSLELTTAETLDALVRTGFKKDDSYALVKSVLTNADLVKFAKFNPEPADNELHYQQAWDFVQATQEKAMSLVTEGEKDKVMEVKS